MFSIRPISGQGGFGHDGVNWEPSRCGPESSCVLYGFVLRMATFSTSPAWQPTPHSRAAFFRVARIAVGERVSRKRKQNSHLCVRQCQVPVLPPTMCAGQIGDFKNHFPWRRQGRLPSSLPSPRKVKANEGKQYAEKTFNCATCDQVRS